MALTNALAVGYEDPALEGQNITFTCASNQILIGPNTSTCMENGEWEPDPREVACTGTPVTTTTSLVTTIGTCNASISELIIIIVYVVFTRPLFTENMFVYFY